MSREFIPCHILAKDIFHLSFFMICPTKAVRIPGVFNNAISQYWIDIAVVDEDGCGACFYIVGVQAGNRQVADTLVGAVSGGC
jgi:hypothetical protein